MHKQVVGGVSFLTFLIRNTGCHRYGGNASRANEGVYFTLCQLAHNNAANQTTAGGENKGNHTQNNDRQSLDCQEVRANHSSANRGTQQNGYDVHQRILCGIGQTLGNTGFVQQVTEHKTANQRRSVRQQQSHKQSNSDGEYNFFRLGNSTRLLHLDFSLLLGSQQLHKGRLNHRNQRHIRVSGNRNRTQKMGSKLRGKENSGRTVCATDDTDGSGFLTVEAQNDCAHKCGKYAHLCSSAQKQALGVREQRTKIGHCANA